MRYYQRNTKNQMSLPKWESLSILFSPFIILIILSCSSKCCLSLSLSLLLVGDFLIAFPTRTEDTIVAIINLTASILNCKKKVGLLKIGKLLTEWEGTYGNTGVGD